MPLPRASQLPSTITISTSTFFKAVAIGAGLAFLWFIRDILAILIAALLLAALVDPAADWFERHHIPRGLGVMIVYVVFGAFIITSMILIAPVVVEQSGQLVTNLSASYGNIADYFGRFLTFSNEHGFGDNLRASLQSVQDAITGSFASLFTTVRGFVASIATLFLVLVLAFYMVAEEGTARKYFRHIAPIEYQPYVSQLLIRMQERMGAWLRGQLILGLIVGLAVYIGLSVLGIKYALLLALIAGMFEVVPYLGPILSLIPAAIIGFAQGPVQGVSVVILYFIIQQLENNVLVPKVMQKVTGLNPVFSLLAIMVGLKVGGLVGAILSIPLATMAAVVLEDLFSPEHA